jgi:hypothetical protein
VLDADHLSATVDAASIVPPDGVRKKGGRLRLARHDVSSPSADPRSMNVFTMRWPQPVLTTPWPVKGAVRCVA